MKMEINSEDGTSSFCSAKILCCLCNEYTSVRQYGRSKKDGSKGSERWVLSNFETHLRSHTGKNARKSEKSSSERDIKTLFSAATSKKSSNINEVGDSKNDSTEAEDNILLDSASGEGLTAECQERILREEKKSSAKE